MTIDTIHSDSDAVSLGAVSLGAVSSGAVSSGAGGLRRAIPNLLTLGNLACGVVALLLFISGAPHWQALAALAGSLVFDLMDGRVARALKVSGPLGAQLDSLADLVSFGLVPAVVAYVAVLSRLGMVGILGSVSIAAAAAWRLARFTVDVGAPATDTGAPDGPPCFAGIPVTIPAAIIVGIAGTGLVIPSALALVGVLALAALMVSRLPFRSFKEKPALALVGPLVVCCALILSVFGSAALAIGATLAGAGLLFVATGLLGTLQRRSRAV